MTRTHGARRTRLVAFSFILLGTLAACGEAAPDHAATPSIDTVNGVVVVENRESGLWRQGEEWIVEEQWRAAELDLEEEREADPDEERALFQRPASVTLGPNGQIFVLDFASQNIVVFDARGGFVRQFGGTGQGPGEFDGPLAMGWDARDRLWVPEGWNQRYSLFDSAGVFLESIPRDLPVARFHQRLVFDGGGGFLDELVLDQEQGLVRVDTTGTVIDTLAPLNRPRAARRQLPPVSLGEAAAFIPQLVHTVLPDGSVWLAESDALRLIHRSPRGDTLRIIETSHREASLTPQEERMIEEELRQADFSASDIAFARRIVQGIHVLNDGHLLVQIEEEPGEDGRVLDVFDPEGRFLGSVETDVAMIVGTHPAIRGDMIVGVARGELDVPFIFRSTIVRP